MRSKVSRGPVAVLERPGARRGTDVVTVRTTILEAIGNGVHGEVAAASAGISRAMFLGWLRDAAKLASDGRPAHTMTRDEQALMRFASDYQQAEAAYEVRMNELLHKVSTGELVKSHTMVELDSGGQVIRTINKTETMLPDARTILQRLQARFPARYRQGVEVTGAEGGPIEVSVRLSELVGQLAALKSGTVIDTEVIT